MIPIEFYFLIKITIKFARNMNGAGWEKYEKNVLYNTYIYININI